MPRHISKRTTTTTTRRTGHLVAAPEHPAVFDQELHVLDLGRGVMLDVFINIEGRLTTFLSIDGRLLMELQVLGHA
ncbi:hypothetical protein [Chondromyces apiculatus]|uniref:Uncharacterized protein n=1 Tax=Chondromyces apiculatus DSM 436 TaxID=1192034 RepID=A0A017T4X3_9BACT|nr:hypothetical protein [Chondromyces apiculatus]EYF04323.1 Hypothetical protein CAP_4587 [Chondromyces apiculatus DSM 436]